MTCVSYSPRVIQRLIEEHKEALSAVRFARKTRPDDARENCPICLEPLNARIAVSHTGCGHLMHHTCLVNWLTNNRSCPTCRNPFTAVVSQSKCFMCGLFNVEPIEKPYVQMHCCGTVMHYFCIATAIANCPTVDCCIACNAVVENNNLQFSPTNQSHQLFHLH